MKKITAIAWLIMMLMTLVASPAFATDWDSENVTMKIGETKTLNLPYSVTSRTLKSVSFYSASYKDVEVVSYTASSVKVKALKATSTPVVVRCDYYYYINNGGYMYENGGVYDFMVTVKGEITVKPTKITLPSHIVLEVGESQDIVPTVTPSNAGYTLTWSISDSSVATIYNNGMITGKSVGYADLKVKADNGVYAMSRVSVYQPTPTSISIKSSLSMDVGDTYTLSPNVYPTNSKYTLSWTSNNTSVATVSSSGVVTAKGAGTANITVTTANGKTATCMVSVSAKSVTSVSVKSTLSMEVGDTYTLTPTVTPSDAETSFIWFSDKSSVATVSQYGVVTANGAGTANITVMTGNGMIATCVVNVTTQKNKVYIFSYYIYDGGKVLCNEKTLVGYDRFNVKEGSDVKLTIVPDDGYKVHRLCVDYVGVNDQLINNVLPINNVHKDTHLTVSFEKDDSHQNEPTESLGDTDDNGLHTLNDVVCIINHIQNQPNITFVEAAADLDENGKITVNDAVLLISRYILDLSNIHQTTHTEANNGDNDINIEDIKMKPGEIKTINIQMTNDCDDIKGIQFDITLPTGISFIYNEDTEEYVASSWRIPSRMTLSCEKQNENTLRIAGVCTGFSSIYSHSGSVFTFKVKADENIIAGMYQIKLSNMELSTGEAISIDDHLSSLEIGNSTSGIETLAVDKQEKPIIYDLRGQQVDVSKAKNGLFIVNGKKVIVK